MDQRLIVGSVPKCAFRRIQGSRGNLWRSRVGIEQCNNVVPFPGSWKITEPNMPPWHTFINRG